MSQLRSLCRFGAMCGLVMVSWNCHADEIRLNESDFTVQPVFSAVGDFTFSIRLDVKIEPGTRYSDPVLSQVDYQVRGLLTSTPSGFPAFNLIRSIGGTEFYDQGSSMEFEVALNADLSDGLQVSELVGEDIVFTFNAREVGTGRYHPALLELNANGTGTLRNSNNFGGINPVTEKFVDVEIGEEYITDLTFDPTTLTLFIDLIYRDGFE